MFSFRQLIHDFAIFEYLYYCNVSQDNRIKVGITVTDNMGSNIKTLELERAWVVTFLFFCVSPLSVSLSLCLLLFLSVYFSVSLYICLSAYLSFFSKIYEIFGWTEVFTDRCLVAIKFTQFRGAAVHDWKERILECGDKAVKHQHFKDAEKRTIW